MAAISVRVLDSFEALREELRQPGIQLAPCAETDIFSTLPWFENLFRHGLEVHADTGAALQLLMAADSATGSMVCLPLMGGKNLRSLSNYYSSLYGPVQWTLPHPEYDTGRQLWDAAGKFMYRRRPHWPVITFSPLDPQAIFFAQLVSGLSQAGFWVDDFFCFGNWYLEVKNRGFADYFAALPSPLRHSIERGRRRLSRQGKWSIEIRHTSDTLLDGAINDFVHVYGKSWKGPEPNVRFMPALIRMAAEQHWLRLGVLKLDGAPIAAQLWLVKDKKALIYKLAFAQGFERFSAGSVLTSALMQHVMDVDLVQEVDYLSGDDAYKRDWMSHRRERRGIVAFHPRAIAGLWAACKHFAGKTIGKWKLP